MRASVRFSLVFRYRAAGVQACRRFASLLALPGALALAACGGDSGSSPPGDTSNPPGDTWSWTLPASFPVPKVPASNPMSAGKVALGRYLFYDRRLSGNNTQSCATCHTQSRAFTDRVATSPGSTGQPHPRNAQGLANVVYSPTLTWANPTLTTLEKQMEAPLFGTQPIEMGVNDENRALVLARLAALPGYVARFASVFPGEAEPINWPNVIQAIAAFQRTILSGNSRHDQALRGEATLTDAEQRGMALFFGDKALCSRCHAGFNFNDQVVHAASDAVDTPFHNTGLYDIDGAGGFPAPNRGVFEVTGQATDMGAFRAPSLRNVEVTAPYMHDGSVATLAAALDFYAAGGREIAAGPNAGDGRANPYKSPLIGRISLTADERADIVDFLKTLTDRAFLADPAFSDPFVAGPP